MKYKFQWNGKELSECTKEELIAALDQFCDRMSQSIDSQVEFEVNRKTRDLKQELKIKDALIDKLVSRP